MKAILGTENGLEFTYPLEVLKKHFIALGSSGSGKTVLCKAVIEEAMMKQIPAILVDPQGDLASLVLNDKVDDLVHKTKLENLRDCRITVFTPTSSKGVPISINPLKLPEQKLEHEELVSILNQISNSICKLIGYRDDDNGKAAQALLYLILNHCYKKRKNLETFDQLINIIEDLPWTVKREAKPFLKIREELAKKLKFLTIGEKELLFQYGVPLDIETLLRNDEDKTQISIIYLNTLENNEDREFFLSILATNLYEWMLEHPAKALQCLFFIDEVAKYIPAGAKKPITKPILKLIYKQARKYGVGCLVSTQNPGDIDYTCFSQFGTWAIGRLTTKQDKAKVKDTLESLAGNKIGDITDKLPKLKPGEFMLFSPDAYDDIKHIKVRRLLTKHSTLNDHDIKKITTDEIRSRYRIIDIKTDDEEEEPKITLSKPEVKTPKKKKELKSKEIKYNLLYFPMDIEEEMIEHLIEKNRKKSLITRKPVEEIVERSLIFEPIIRSRIKIREKKMLGMKEETNEYVVFFDGNTGNILRFKEDLRYKDFVGFAKLFNIDDSKLEVFRTLYDKKEAFSASYIASLINGNTRKVKNDLDKLREEKLVKHEKKFDKWSINDGIEFPKSIEKLSSANVIFTRQDVKGNIVDNKIDIKSLTKILRLWFQRIETVDLDVVYYPMYNVAFEGKKKKRHLQISAVDGRVIE